MNVTQLKYFIRVAELSSISKAAYESGITTPAISNHIKSIEDELGAKLFTREGTQLTLNKNGETAYHYAQKIIGTLNDAEKEIADHNHHMNYRLKVATLTTPRTIPKLICQFHATYPEPHIQVNQYQKYSEQHFQDTDVVIYSTEFFVQRENSRLLYEEPILLAVSKEHPLAKYKEVEIPQLKNERFIRRTKYSDFARYVEQRYFEFMGISPQTAIVADPHTTEMKLVTSNFGVAFMPQLSCVGMTDKIALVKVKGVDMKRYINILWRDWGYQSAAMKLFVEFAGNFFARLRFGDTND